MKKRYLCFFTALTVLLSGCASMSGNVDSLLRPPMLSDEQNDIWKVLKKDDAENGIKLVYPQRGDNRSAILLTNIDDEPSKEAIVFFQPSNAVTSSLIGIKVLDEDDGKWKMVSELNLDGTQLEDVSVINVGTGIPAIAIGLNYTADGNHLLQVLQFDGKQLHTVFSKNYQVKEFYDMNADGNEDIFVIENPESEVKVWARAYEYKNNGFAEIGSVTVNPEINHYVLATRGNTAQGKEAVFVDGYKGTELMTTEILSYDKESKTLMNFTFDGETPQKYPVDRAPVVTCRDLTKDGIVEVPGVRPLPGYEEGSEDVLFLTDWYHFTDNKFEKRNSSFVNTNLGYIFEFPEKWIGKVSARTSGENEVLFYEYSPESNLSGNPILHLRVATRSDWLGKKISSEYELIDTEGQIVYLAKIPDTESEYKITVSKVKEYFDRIY